MKPFKISLMILWALLYSNSQTIAQNLLTDGGFDATPFITPYYTGAEPQNIWCSWLNNGTNVSTEVNSGECKYTIANAGSQSWEVQLIQWGFPLELGYAYQLSFDVKADADRTFGIYIGEQGGSWNNLNKNYLQSATTTWQTITITFNVTQVASLQKLSFEMGGAAINMYFDNIVLTKTGPMPAPKIDIIGSAVPPYDWSVGVDMQTTDGLNYLLSNFTLQAGAVKFRQDQDWAINWGGNSFPMGNAIRNGPDIAVMAGTYDIHFNWATGEYSFTCPTCPPGIGIIGSSVPPYNWLEDVKMTTSDGMNYVIEDYLLINGELKFRQNSSWAVNWGGTDFPSGTATLNGPNIPVMQGLYDIAFNRIKGEYSFIKNIPPVGIIGSSLNGWDVDVDMESEDGIDYILKNTFFNSGEVKFRQDNSWKINWGSNTFPWGTGFQNGPNIVVPEGNYDVYFNRLYGNYYFQLLCSEPTLNCPADIVIGTEPGKCGAAVYYNMPTPTDNCGSPVVYQVSGQPSGSFFEAGQWTQQFVVVNSSGKTAYCSFNITVEDKEPPTISDLSASAVRLWPANHKMAAVKLYYDTWDNCGNVNTSITVTSNEPDNSNGDGDMAPDWIIIDNHTVELRAERSGKGNDRIYTIIIAAVDPVGNTSTKTIEVIVPHDESDMKGKATYSATVTPNVSSSIQTIVSPNPSQGGFTLYMNSSRNEKASIRILDLSGKVISRMNAGTDKAVRFGYDLLPGVYIVEISQGAQRTFQKIVKQ